MKTKDKIKAHSSYDASGRQERINQKELIALSSIIEFARDYSDKGSLIHEQIEIVTKMTERLL